MKKFLFLLFALLPTLVFSQIEASKTEHDFGAIERGTDRVVDFTFTNRGDKKAFLLRSAFPREFAHLFSDRELQPDSSITLRVKFNPMFKERVDYEIPIYFSSMPDPINLEFTGEVLFIDPADNPACPSFNERKPQSGSSFDVEFVVTNKVTGDPIEDAQVRLIERGRQINAFSTDRDGRVVEVIPIRYFYILVEADGYLPADSSSYINRRNNFFEFELEPKERENIEMTAQESRPAGQVETQQPEAQPELARPDVIVQPAPEENIPEVDEDDFSPDQFVHNNLVFLVDVSSSMNRSGRLDIMKAAMLELVDMLREVDQLTILTYAADTEVIVQPTFVTNKEQIREMIRNISAEGFTAGSKAVQTAYSLAADHFVEGGNNQVLLVSDGVFRSSDTRRIQQSVERYVEKDIYLSIVGLKCNPDHEEELSTFAASGGGLFVPISHFDQAGYMLTEAIRRQSRVN